MTLFFGGLLAGAVWSIIQYLIPYLQTVL